MKDTFYMVYNPSGHYPTVQHSTLEDAQREANRLAYQNPTVKFYILKSIAAGEYIPPINWNKAEGIELPF